MTRISGLGGPRTTANKRYRRADDMRRTHVQAGAAVVVQEGPVQILITL
jgi:hypothetical protein